MDTDIHIQMVIEGVTAHGSVRFREMYKPGATPKMPRRTFYLRPEAFEMIGVAHSYEIVIRAVGPLAESPAEAHAILRGS